MSDTCSNLLDTLLSVVQDELQDSNKVNGLNIVKLKEVNNENEDATFLQKISSFVSNKSEKCTSEAAEQLVSNSESKKKSNIHSGDTDSSDDEGNRYFENAKYNEFGRNVKHLLPDPSASSDINTRKESTWKDEIQRETSGKQLSLPPSKVPYKADVYTDPVFGIRIVKPLVSSSVLQERMKCRAAVPMSKIKLHVQKLSPDSDWVIAGVIVHKSNAKTSQKGSQFCIWTLSDLHNDLKTVALFVFGNAYQQLWKTVVGTVVGILNPTVLDRNDSSKDEAALSIDNAQKVMTLGQSKDLGTCKSIKKNGDKCTAFVNVNQCEFCLYHVKKEYQKCSLRSELQSNFSGRGLVALRNKVLGKNEVFYAGKSYMAIPASKSKKLAAKDDGRLKSLSGLTVNSIKRTKTNNVIQKKNAVRLEVSRKQRLKDLELLKKLGGVSDSNLSDKSTFRANLSSTVTLQDSKQAALNAISKLKANQPTVVENLPTSDVKADLIVGVDEKHNFTSQLSKEVTLEDSKKSALTAIAKLKTKQIRKECDNYRNSETELQKENKNESQDIKDKTSRTQVSKEISLETERVNTKSTTDSKKCDASLNIPLLSGRDHKTVDLNAPISRRRVDRAKSNALTWVQQNGPIKKSNPMNTRGCGKKRPREMESEELNPEQQKIQKNEFFSERFKKLMATTSRHMDLIEQKDNEEQEKYFNKLETRERMEEKMLTTYKLQCKAVRCLKCKYTSFSASDYCKAEKHPLKVFDGVKRFFKCGDCGNRTVTLDVIPTVACKNCGSGKWERTAMMKEKVVQSAHTLSIRGGEQTFINSNLGNANLNLMIPDDQ